MSIKKVRISDASSIKGLIDLKTLDEAREFIRNKTLYSDTDFTFLVSAVFSNNHSLMLLTCKNPDSAMTDELLRFFFFEKHIHRISIIIPISDLSFEEILLQNGFVQEAVLHDEIKVNDSYEDAGLFFITRPMYRNYNVGFLPFQRGVIAVRGSQDYVDEVSFMRFDEQPADDYIRDCADYAGLMKDGKLKRRGDSCYEDINFEGLPFEVSRALEEIREYLLKKRTSFDINVRPSKFTDFQNEVWEQIRKIPYGFTRSYEDIALELTSGDMKKASKLTRAVGHACSLNPVPIIVPCHRVIGKDGRLVGFKDGIEFKDFLLTHELFAALQLA